MHCLHGLTAQDFQFELKGGTSLSKGFALIERFSEDIDIRINPSCAPFKVHVGPNQQREKHILSRGDFYDWITANIQIPGTIRVLRDREFDDSKLRSAGIRLVYDSAFHALPSLKRGILLEVGFDDTYPNILRSISSWAYEKAVESGLTILNNRADGIRCYHPGYTFVEKLQAISTKFRQQQASGRLPPNFMRHYYDVSQLLGHEEVLAFIGTPEYFAHKRKRFRRDDNPTISQNEAFLLSDPDTRILYERAYLSRKVLYYGKQVPLHEILSNIQRHFNSL